MRLLLVMDEVNCGGAELSFFALCRGLAARANVHVALSAASLENPTIRAQWEGLRGTAVTLHPCRTRLHPGTVSLLHRRLRHAAASELAHLLQRVRPDFIVVNLPTVERGQPVLDAAERTSPRPPVWGFLHLPQKPSTIGAKLGKLRNLLVPRQLRRFDGLLTVSSAGAREVAERYGMHAPEVLHPPAASIPGNSFLLDRTSRLVAEGLPTGVFLLGLVGRVQVHHKGHDAALRVLQRLVDVGLQVHLVVVGDGPDLETVRALANRLGLSNRVSFLGWRDDVGELIPLFNAVIMPSRFEGMPLVALQAAAARVPVAGYAVDGLAELLPPEFTAPPSDEAALAKTLVDLIRGSLSWPADELARRARSWSDPEEAAVRLLTILESNTRGRAVSAGSAPLAKNAENVQKVLPR